LQPSSETSGKNGTYSGGPGKHEQYHLRFLEEAGVQLKRISFPENALNLVTSSRDSVATLSGRTVMQISENVTSSHFALHEVSSMHLCLTN
jgi:hypothetical protein